MSSNRVKIGFSGIEYHSKTMRCQLNHCTFLNTRLSKGKLFGDVKICMKIFIVDHQNLKLLKEQDFLSKRLRFFDSDDVRCKQLQFLVPSERSIDQYGRSRKPRTSLPNQRQRVGLDLLILSCFFPGAEVVGL